MNENEQKDLNTPCLSDIKMYEGKKEVNACPMSKHAFAKIVKNMTIDDLKKGEEDCPGYLVVYKDGYRRWSPKEQFEEAYKLCESPLDRLKIEYIELYDKFLKLTSFLSRKDREVIAGPFQVELMEDQRSYMRSYLSCLLTRIKDFNTKQDER